ncbi:hypothetical protein MTO96_047264 [Rhipicephalus appendiculatus]
MEIEVDGIEISLEEWTDDSWTPPQGFRAQAKRHLALKQQAQLKDAEASKAPQASLTPRPPPELKRNPLPRLPSHTYHIVGRPKTPIDLTRTSPGDLQTALLKAASLPDLNPANRDQIRIHTRNNTFTVSVATTDRAIAYQRIRSVVLEGDRKIEIHIPGTALMYALNLGADAARVAEKTTSLHPKERHRHAKHAVSSVKEGT